MENKLVNEFGFNGYESAKISTQKEIVISQAAATKRCEIMIMISEFKYFFLYPCVLRKIDTISKSSVPEFFKADITDSF